MADTDPLVLSEPELSLLPLELARQLLFSRYVMVGTAVVFIWEILSNLRADYTLLFKRKLAWPVAAYFLSSTCAAFRQTYMSDIPAAYPVEGCRSFHLGVALLYPIAIPATSLLFFFRVRAIYGGTRAVTIIFGLMWIAVLATSIIIPIATIGVNIGPSCYCILVELMPYVGAVSITPGLFDTAVFVAISYRLMGNTHVEYNSFKQKARAFFLGAYLPSLSRSLFVDGRVYYMITVVSNIASFLLVCLPGVAIAYRSLLAIPNMMLNNVMACRLYRHTRLELAQQSFLFPTIDLGTHSHLLHFASHTPPRGVKDCEVGSERQDALHEIGD
ncbi:hypothetical protein K438DRAFT_1878785 [Mycena galopus ATCC 62051]|nr:hypothetical protein K438DRAFT_1878785 [Mycena galopus ATCC 62051]